VALGRDLRNIISTKEFKYLYEGSGYHFVMFIFYTYLNLANNTRYLSQLILACIEFNKSNVIAVLWEYMFHMLLDDNKKDICNDLLMSQSRPNSYNVTLCTALNLNPLIFNNLLRGCDLEYEDIRYLIAHIPSTNDG